MEQKEDRKEAIGFSCTEKATPAGRLYRANRQNVKDLGGLE